MSNIIIISTHLDEIRFAKLKGGKTIFYLNEDSHQKSILGNIYKARITRRVRSLDAFFVDIGEEKQGFLASESDFFSQSNKLSEGQDILVQVIKEPHGNKAYRVSRNIRIPGFYVVLTPNNKEVRVSRKIASSESSKAILKRFQESGDSRKGGFILRSQAKDASYHTVKTEFEQLTEKWGAVESQVLHCSSPIRLWEEASLVTRGLREHYTTELDSITVDSQKSFEEAHRFFRDYAPTGIKILSRHEGHYPLFDDYDIETDIAEALGHSVDLKSGGSITIQSTEALTAIDVNSGRDLRKSRGSIALRTNLQAAKTIVQQILLRNISGIIAIDFIDMKDDREKDLLLSTVQEELLDDRVSSEILPLNPFGIMHITRQRKSSSLEERLLSQCPSCSGSGRSKRHSVAAYDLSRSLERVSQETKTVLKISGSLYRWIRINRREIYKAILEKQNIELEVVEESKNQIISEGFNHAYELTTEKRIPQE